MKDPGVYVISHRMPQKFLYHLGSECRMGPKSTDAEHFITDDPEEQLKMIKDQIKFGLENKCPDMTKLHEQILYSRILLVPKRQHRPEDILIFRRRFGNKINP